MVRELFMSTHHTHIGHIQASLRCWTTASWKEDNHSHRTNYGFVSLSNCCMPINPHFWSMYTFPVCLRYIMVASILLFTVNRGKTIIRPSYMKLK